MFCNDVSKPDPRRWAMFVVLLVGAFLPPLDFLSSILHSRRSVRSWVPRPLLNSWSFLRMLRFMP